MKTWFLALLLVLVTSPSFGATPPPRPTISIISPTHGAVNSSVYINGTNLQNASAVRIGTRSVSFLRLSPIQILAFLPVGVTDGHISVTTPGGTVTSAVVFIITPRLVSAAPLSGKPGTVVSISGYNLNSITSVSLNGTPAPFVHVTSNLIRASVPQAATTGLVTATTPLTHIVGTITFTVLPGPPLPDHSIFPGVYSGTYRGQDVGAFFFTVNGNGVISGMITSSSQTNGMAGHTTTSSGLTRVSCVSQSINEAVTLRGAFSLTSGVKQATGTWLSHGLEGTWNARQAPATSPFAGHYTGTCSGSENGTFTLQVDSRGYATVVAHSPSVGIIEAFGIVDSNGGFIIMHGGFNGDTGGGVSLEQAVFTGLINASGATGHWNTTAATAGTWTARKT